MLHDYASNNASYYCFYHSCDFFITADSIGKPRAEVVTELLCEMNSDVKGQAKVAQYSNEMLQTKSGFFTSFNLVFASNMPDEEVLLSIILPKFEQ